MSSFAHRRRMKSSLASTQDFLNIQDQSTTIVPTSTKSRNRFYVRPESVFRVEKNSDYFRSGGFNNSQKSIHEKNSIQSQKFSKVRVLKRPQTSVGTKTSSLRARSSLLECHRSMSPIIKSQLKKPKKSFLVKNIRNIHEFEKRTQLRVFETLPES